MGLKFEIDQTDFDALDEGVKGFYTQDGDKYKLAVDGLPQGEDVSGLKSKVDELLAEKKQAQQKAKEAEEAAKQAAAEAAKKNGDYEALYKSAQAELEKKTGQFQELQQSIQKKEISSQAMRVASELADGNNIELLKPFIEQRLKYTDDGIKVLDQTGQPTVSSLDDLKNEFQSSGRYDALLRGNQAAGGGAAGGHSGGGAAKQVTRSQWDSMGHKERAAFSQDGGKVVND